MQVHLASSCRSDELYVNSFVIVTTLWNKQAQSIQWT